MKIKLSNLPTEACQHCDGTGQVPSYAAIGAMLAEKRKAKGLTLRKLAKRMKISISYLSDLEQGRKKWNDERIAEYVRNLEDVEIQ